MHGVTCDCLLRWLFEPSQIPPRNGFLVCAQMSNFKKMLMYLFKFPCIKISSVVVRKTKLEIRATWVHLSQTLILPSFLRSESRIYYSKISKYRFSPNPGSGFISDRKRRWVIFMRHRKVKKFFRPDMDLRRTVPLKWKVCRFVSVRLIAKKLYFA